jgi:hypothetical protein
MLLFVVLSRLFTEDYVKNSIVAVGSLLLFMIAALYFSRRWNARVLSQSNDAPFGRRAREIERERQLRYAQQHMRNPPIIRIVQ